MKSALLLLVFFIHCNTNQSLDSEKDLIIAHTALKRAKKASADKFFPKSYRRAQSFYKKAMILFQNDQSDSAKKYFQKSIEISEKIELHSLYKKKRDSEI